MKLTGAAILVSRGMKVLQAAPAAYPYRSTNQIRNIHMFDEVKSLIEKSSAPESVRLALSLVTKAISWLPWVFVGVGLFLNASTLFPYWLGFFIFAEGALLATFIYILLLIVRDAVAATHKNDQPEDKIASSNFSDTALKGVIGNFAFYLFILATFVILKAIGLFDSVFQTTLDRLK